MCERTSFQSRSQVIHYLTQTQQAAACLFFFCGYDRRDDYLLILRTLLRQAISQLDSTSLEAQNSFAQHAKSQTLPVEVNYLLSAVIRTLAKRVYIVIDGLDQLEEKGHRKLLRTVTRLTDSLSSSVNVIVTSRARAYLAKYLTDIREMEINPPSEAILMFANARLTPGSLARILEPDPELKSRILHTIAACSNNMYVKSIDLKLPIQQY